MYTLSRYSVIFIINIFVKMLILSLYDAITGYSVKDEPYMICAANVIDNVVAILQNIFIAYVYFFSTNPSTFHFTVKLIFIIALIGWFFITHYEIYLHHIILYAICIFAFSCKLDLVKHKDSFKAFIGTELSTIFLSIRDLIKATGYGMPYLAVVNVIFALVFLYTRIYLFGKHFYRNMKGLWDSTRFVFFSCVVIFALNLYWSQKIIYKGYQQLICGS
jgi:hypothetical protein